MRAVLISNPQSTTASPSGERDLVLNALSDVIDLEVVETERPGDAIDIARRAAAEAADLVIACGGDGTVNEIVNGLLTDHADGGAAALPVLGVVPAGSTNVFGRALGLPHDQVQAAHRLSRAIEARTTRTIGLGRANDRWFTFNAGLGWDAEVIAEVERLRDRGHRATPRLYLRAAATCYFRNRHQQPCITVEAPGHAAVGGLYTAIVSNTDPWTYLGVRPVRMNPATTFDNGLGLVALRTTGWFNALSHARSALSKRDKPDGDDLLRHTGLPRVHVSSSVPLRLQADGDSLGECTEVEFVSVPRILRVAV